MNEVIELRTYSEFKNELDKELRANAEGFVKIGYLLKVARDTNVLSESGYKNVAEFAQAEYGLSKDVVSRYIAINDRYSEDGYSARLKTQYEGFGVAKLQEMLTLPDSIIEQIEPTLTRKEIQEIKKEVAAEQEISPIEVAFEAAAPENIEAAKELTLTQRIWKEYFHEAKEDFKKLIEINPVFIQLASFVDILAPTGCAAKWARLPGLGKYMISIKGKDKPIVFTNIRDNSTVEQSIMEAVNDFESIFDSNHSIEKWEALYGESFEEHKAEAPKEEPKTEEPLAAVKEEKSEVAPVQPYENEHKDIVSEENEYKESVSEESESADSFEAMNQPIDNTEPPREVEVEVVEHPEEEQIPGQTSISDFPEALPKVEAEVVEDREDTKDIQKQIEYMLTSIQIARRTLAEHIDDGAITKKDLDFAIRNLKSVIDSAESLKKEVADE